MINFIILFIYIMCYLFFNNINHEIIRIKAKWRQSNITWNNLDEEEKNCRINRFLTNLLELIIKIKFIEITKL